MNIKDNEGRTLSAGISGGGLASVGLTTYAAAIWPTERQEHAPGVTIIGAAMPSTVVPRDALPALAMACAGGMSTAFGPVVAARILRDLARQLETKNAG